MAHALHSQIKRLILVASSCLAAAGLSTVSASAIDDTELLQPVIVKEDSLQPCGSSVLPADVTEENWYEGLTGNLYYCYADGTYATGITTLPNGETYLFALDGTLKTGWQTVNGLRFYFNHTTGQKQFGWVLHSNRLYYVFEETGKQVGETQIDGIPYVFDEFGVLQTGIYTCTDGTVAGCDADATPYTGWVTTEEGAVYYFNETGIALTGLQVIEEDTYCFGTDGIMQTGLVTMEDGRVLYFGEDGKQATGFQTVDGNLYYFTETDMLKNQLYTIEDATYYFDADGIMQTGLVTMEDGTILCFDEDGKQAMGLQTVEDKTYYFTELGMTVNQMQEIDGATYYFGADGTMQTGMVVLQDGTYHFSETGAMTTGWLTLDGAQYYFDLTTGQMATGTVTLPDGTYLFDENGVFQKKEETGISYAVPYYNQADPRWGSTYIGTKTIAQVGCLVTALAMTQSYYTGTEILPDEMRYQLQFSNNSLLWAPVIAMGYEIESCSGLSTSAFCQRLYTLLKEHGPVIVGADNVYGGSHYVVVTGCTNPDSSTLKTSDFTINDPGFTDRITLNQHLASYPTWFHFYYMND